MGDILPWLLFLSLMILITSAWMRIANFIGQVLHISDAIDWLIRFFNGGHNESAETRIHGKESVHDYIVSAYRVDLHRGCINLDVISDDAGPNVSHKNIEFMGVVGHRFEHEMAHSIILDIEEVSISRFIERNYEVLKKGLAYGWPIDVRHVEELGKTLNKTQKRCFEISASSGLNGWVLADDYRIS